MDKKKYGEGNTYSISITNAPSCANELSGPLMPGDGVNMAVVQRSSVKRGMANCDFEGAKKTSHMGHPSWKPQ